MLNIRKDLSAPNGVGATDALIKFAMGLRWSDLDAAVKHAAKRHVLDTLGAIIAGAAGDLTDRVEGVLGGVRVAGQVVVPGRKRRADLLDAAFISGTAGHGTELDDGYRLGSVHPGVPVVPAVAALAYEKRVGGLRFLEAVVIGYETVCAVSRICHPLMRRRGFHPTGVVGVLGAAMASARLLDLAPDKIANALGIAASSGAGLFAFLNGGADVKRLHAGHAAREGLQAALFAANGIEGPPQVFETVDGFAQAFAFGQDAASSNFTLSPGAPFGITDCYVKPYACCRHLQPAVEALIDLMKANSLKTEDVKDIKVETYSIAAAHAHTDWVDFASAQLSFPYIMALGLKYGWIKLEHFKAETRQNPEVTRLCKLVHVEATPEMDALYPQHRPAKVTVTTSRGVFHKEAMEALGAPELPLSDDGLGQKFLDLVSPSLGADYARRILDDLWRLDSVGDIVPLFDATRPQ